MMTVIEGVDGSGKTTLIKNARMFNRHFVTFGRNGVPRTIPQLAAEVYALWDLSGLDIDILVDRHPLISEPIYGPILRGTNRLSNLYTPSEVDLRIKNSIDRIVYCRPSMTRIVENVKVEKQLSGIVENLASLVLAYDRAMTRIHRELGVPVFWYDYENHKLETREEIFFGDSK